MQENLFILNLQQKRTDFAKNEISSLILKEYVFKNK